MDLVCKKYIYFLLFKEYKYYLLNSVHQNLCLEIHNNQQNVVQIAA